MNRQVLRNSALAVLLLCLLMIAGLYMVHVRPFVVYMQKNHQISLKLTSLEPLNPPEVDPTAWKNLVMLTNIAFGNVFHHPSLASYAEMLRFQADLEAKLKSDTPVREPTLRWIWKRLGETGPHGKQYSERMIQLFNECAAQLQPAG